MARFHLQLLQLPDVGVTLQLQVPHLVLVFLVLMQTLALLPLFLLTSKLNQSTKRLHATSCRRVPCFRALKSHFAVFERGELLLPF